MPQSLQPEVLASVGTRRCPWWHHEERQILAGGNSCLKLTVAKELMKQFSYGTSQTSHWSVILRISMAEDVGPR